MFIFRLREKQKIIEALKVNKKEQTQNTSVGLFKLSENPFLHVKKTESKPATSGLFSVKTEEKPKPTPNNLFSAKATDNSTTSGLFSVISSSSTTTGNSLFGFSNKPSFSLPKNEPQNSLFTSVNKPDLSQKKSEFDLFKKQTESDINNLFSANSQLRAFQTVPDSDPLKRKPLLFLNKLESDVTFKVEDQEFPAHKAILSEKCRFFKNMFSSISLELKSQTDFLKVECLSHTLL